VPKQLNNGQITQALQRAFGFKGRYIPMLDEVIVPVYVISDPAPAALTRLVAGTIIADNSAEGSFETVQLFNPTGSGIVSVVSNWTGLSNIKQKLNISFFDSPLSVTPILTSAFRDRRVAGSPASELLRGDQLTAVGQLIAVLEVDGSLAQTAAWEAAAGDPRQPLVVLGEGQGVVMQSDEGAGTTNEIVANMRWLEIPITELSPEGGLP